MSNRNSAKARHAKANSSTCKRDLRKEMRAIDDDTEGEDDLDIDINHRKPAVRIAANNTVMV